MKRTSRRVLHVVDSLGLGGTQAILKEYFEAAREDANLHLLGLRSVELHTEIDHPNAAVFPSPSRFSTAPLGVMRRIVRERNIQVVHCHLFRSQVFGWLLKRLSFPDVGLVFHEHGRAMGCEGEPWIESFAFRRFMRTASGAVDHFVCNSEVARDSLLRIAPAAAGKATVVPNPIPVRPPESMPPRDALRRAMQVPEGAFVVGFASRLVERKGWRDFLEAMALLAPRLPVHFLLAGDGEDREATAAQVRARGLHSGRLLGHVSGMDRFYGALDAFAMPSHWEPHGLGHLEAQAFGVPVVVTDVPGLSGTVHRDRDALLVPPHSPQALAEALARIATDPALRDRLAREGRVNAARFTMQGFAATLEAVYASVRPIPGPDGRAAR